MFGTESVWGGAAGDPDVLRMLLSPWTRVVAFVWGLVWGSFANVLIHRLPRGLSIVRPRSRCGTCGASIAWYDNIPVVSFVLLRGRCRHCKQAISLRYVVVELLAGVLAFTLYIRIVVVPFVSGSSSDPVVVLATWLITFAYGLALIVVTYTDLDAWIIPDAVVIPMALCGLGLSVLAPELLAVSWQEAWPAALTGGGFVVLVRWIYLRVRKLEAMGLGDAKLLVMVGAFSGFRGLYWTVSAGALQGLLVAVPLLLLGRNVANSDLESLHGDDPTLGHEDPARGVMGRRVPFGPFLAVAALEFILLRSWIDELFVWLLERP